MSSGWSGVGSAGVGSAGRWLAGGGRVGGGEDRGQQPVAVLVFEHLAGQAEPEAPGALAQQGLDAGVGAAGQQGHRGFGRGGTGPGGGQEGQPAGAHSDDLAGPADEEGALGAERALIGRRCGAIGEPDPVGVGVEVGDDLLHDGQGGGLDRDAVERPREEVPHVLVGADVGQERVEPGVGATVRGGFRRVVLGGAGAAGQRQPGQQAEHERRGPGAAGSGLLGCGRLGYGHHHDLLVGLIPAPGRELGGAGGLLRWDRTAPRAACPWRPGGGDH
ncbi:MAG: hypothetical protein HND58_16675 [Planctomycetota bacterium]|nr:MAG: hypothetical protein HND58_16675 [Planctomycetota bacterium]